MAGQDAAGERQHKRKPATHTIVMEGTSFKPARLTITLGDSVTWVNKDFFPHTATAADAFDSGIIAAGSSWTHTPRTRGAFDYVCTLHPTMRGALQVQEPRR
jgi:plastocyanin